MAEIAQDEALERLPEYDTYAMPVVNVFYDESFNSRGPFTRQSVEDLAASIRDTTLEIPVIVRPWNKDGFAYHLLAGHRRFVAVTEILGWKTIPASIRRHLTEHQARIINYIENLERKDFNPLEEARGLRHLFPEGVSLRVAAAELKRPTRWIQARQRLLTLPEEVQQLAACELLAMCQIEALMGKSAEEQIKIARAHAEVKQKYGKKASLRHLSSKYRRKFGVRKTKNQINAMVAKMLGRGVEGLAPRMGAWCAGYITDRELEHDIEAYHG